MRARIQPLFEEYERNLAEQLRAESLRAANPTMPRRQFVQHPTMSRRERMMLVKMLSTSTPDGSRRGYNDEDDEDGAASPSGGGRHSSFSLGVLLRVWLYWGLGSDLCPHLSCSLLTPLVWCD